MSPRNDNRRSHGSADEIDAVSEIVRSILSELLDGALFNDETDLSSVGLDSMRALELMSILEERLQVDLVEDLAKEFKTVPRIARVVRNAPQKTLLADSGSRHGKTTENAV